MEFYYFIMNMQNENKKFKFYFPYVCKLFRLIDGITTELLILHQKKIQTSS